MAIIFIHHFQTDENAAKAGIADEMDFLLLFPLLALLLPLFISFSHGSMFYIHLYKYINNYI